MPIRQSMDNAKSPPKALSYGAVYVVDEVSGFRSDRSDGKAWPIARQVAVFDTDQWSQTRWSKHDKPQHS